MAMIPSKFGLLTVGILGALMGSVICASALAQAGPPGAPPAGSQPSGPPEVAPPPLQAFVGEWDVTSSPIKTPVPLQGVVPLTPAYEQLRAHLKAMDDAGVAIPGRNAKCIPAGMPNMMVFGFQIDADARHITVIGGTGPSVRHIYLDQTQHTADELLLPTYTGESLGHWEGDTLVIDTVGLDSGNDIFYAMPANNDQLHVVEHWRMLSPASLEILTTVIDPPALLHPYSYRTVYGRRTLHEDARYCVAANDIFKNGKMNITPPAGGYVPPGLKP